MLLNCGELLCMNQGRIYFVASEKQQNFVGGANKILLEKPLESPLDCKEIQPVHPKGDQSWVFIGMTDAEVETPILWPPHVKS